MSQQADWSNSVNEIYDQYHTRRDWTQELIETCRAADIEFMTTPYDFEAVEMFTELVSAYKIGSGDITFHALINLVARQGKTVVLATGAADMADTEAAVAVALERNPALCLLQCNTNYTGSLENFRFVNLRVLQTFAAKWPGMPLGLSDHTPGHSAVLGAIALGGRVIEKHFTDDNSQIGPDHAFALNPVTWRAMVDASRKLEDALGDGVKRIEENEQQTVVIQRRALRAAVDLEAGTALAKEHLEALRPCPAGAISPSRADEVLGRTLTKDLSRGAEVAWDNID